MKLTGKEFAKILADRHQCTIKEANFFIEDFIDVLIEQVNNYNEIGFQKFGVFKRVDRKSKKGVHPTTKQEIVRKPYSTIAFKGSKIVKIIDESSDVEESNDNE